MYKIKVLAEYKAWDKGEEPEASRPLTQEQASVVKQKNPPLSPWVVIAVQVVVGLFVGLVALLLTGKGNIVWSALYGALAVVVPSAVFARGLLSRVTLINPAAAVTGFFLWEMVKIGLVLAMLVAAPRLVTDLSWPAMLVGLVVTMKSVWLVLWVETKARRKPEDINVV